MTTETAAVTEAGNAESAGEKPTERSKDDDASIGEPDAVGGGRDRDGTAGRGTGLDPNVAGALSYLLGPVTGVLFFLLEPEDPDVRFHAAQSTILFGGLFVASVVLSVGLTVLSLIPVVGWIGAAVLGIGSLLVAPVAFLAWLFLMYKAYDGTTYSVPVVGEYARRYAAVK